MTDLRCSLRRQDAAVFLSDLLARGTRPDLLIADPPYNYGQAYASGHSDAVPAHDYRRWLRAWLSAAYDAVADTGALVVFAPDEWVSTVDQHLRDTLGASPRNWLIWYYTFGQACTRKFSRCKTHILYFSRHSRDFTFNRDAVAVPSARQAVYADPRARPGGKTPDDVWVLTRGDLAGVLDPGGDVQMESRVCGTFKARDRVSPNQLPQPLIGRLVSALSNPGDLVCDPFLGTGTTAEAALRAGRGFVGCDVSEDCVAATAERVAAVTGDTPKEVL